MPRLQRKPHAQAGFTLVELLISMSLMLLLLTASLSALTTIERGQRKSADRADALADARSGLERMTRELRQSFSVASTSTATTLAASTFVHLDGAATATRQNVTYACGAGRCTRRVGTGLTTIIPNVANADVFAYAPPPPGAPTYVAIKVVLALRGGKAATLTDGVQLRNQP